VPCQRRMGSLSSVWLLFKMLNVFCIVHYYRIYYIHILYREKRLKKVET